MYYLVLAHVNIYFSCFCSTDFFFFFFKNSVINSGVSKARKNERKKKRKRNHPSHISAPGPGQGAAPAGSASPEAKSVLATGLKRDQPMGLALRAWLGGCLPQFGESRPWTRNERSGVKVRGLSHSVLVLWLRQPEVRVQMWKPKPFGSVVQQRGPEASVQVTESWAGIQRRVGHSILMVQQGLGGWALALLSRGRPVTQGPCGRATLRNTAVQARNVLGCSGG